MRGSLRTPIVTFIVAAAVAGCASPGRPAWTYPPTTKPTAAPAGQMAGQVMPSPRASAATSGAAVAVGSEIAIESFDLGFTPAAITVAGPGTFPVVLRNTGAAVHDVTFADGTKIVADPGATAKGSVTIPAAGLTFLCSIPGHAPAGMTGAVAVAGSAPAPAASGGTPGTATATPVADPAAPPYELRDATAPALPSGTVHDIDLPIVDKDITVAKGFVVHAWTFGGQVPGPTIRVHLGDTVRVHLTNRGSMSHSIDFHASQTAMNRQMVEIAPGETFTYTFTADYAGVWMYHCGTAPALHHIANGMFGMVIVEPEGGLPPVDHEFALVQSEWYLGPQRQPVDYDKAFAAAPAPDFVVFNGIANQYKDNPIAIKTGGRVRVFVLDAGPSIDSSFHVVGTVFDTVIKEGIALARGNTGGWGSQAVDLAPAQGAIVEFRAVEDGMYPLVTHAFNFVGRGALGLFMAGDGDPLN
ncbi:MAG TPA: multicopper oxidase domain-containing protein [Candidatus Limnocylindrales bacterium]|nr:multicopper oxidase domain-containing protein [Candidatus Limnocylindrales bacterium]